MTFRRGIFRWAFSTIRARYGRRAERHLTTRVLASMLVTTCTVVAFAGVCPARSLAAGVPADAETSAIYSGLGSWIDIFAKHARANPGGVVASLRARGVTTLYLETSNYSQHADVVGPAVLGRLIDEAHAQGIHTVGWYLPSFASPQLDARRALAAVRFRSPAGRGFDSFALDIEASVMRDVPRRNVNMLALVRLLRASVPAAYPLGAIIPSPVGMRRHRKYWPRFPFRSLGAEVDVFLPMAYFSYYTTSEPATYAYARDVVQVIRRETGRADVPVHLIGGIANRVTPAALGGFLRAAQDCGVAGLSLYAFLETTRAQWAAIGAATLGEPPTSKCP